MKKFVLFIFSLIIGFAVFCGLHVKATGITLTMSDTIGIRNEGTQQGLRFACSASEDFDGATEHGFYLAIGSFDKATFTAAIEAKATTIGGKPLVNKNTKGTDKDFAITVVFAEDATAEHFGTLITSIAYYKNGEEFVFSNINLTKNVADEARRIYNVAETPADIISSTAEATRVKVTHSDSSVEYFAEIAEVTLAVGDTLDLIRGTYNDHLAVSVANVTVNGTNKDKNFDNDGNRIDGVAETIINNSILLYTGADSLTINGLTIKGSLMDDGNPKTDSWRDSGKVDDKDATRLAPSDTQYGAGIVFFDSHNDVIIKCNKFAMISGSTYAIVDSCKDNVTIVDEKPTEYKFASNRQKNLTITNNYIDFAAGTAYSCDIFFRGNVYNTTISSNYFKNNYNTGSDTFSYDHCIRLWRIGNSSTANTTITISDNTFAHTKTNIGIDLGLAANLVKTTQTINIQRNTYGDYTRRGLRICNMKNGETVNVVGNDMTISTISSVNYAVLISGGTAKDNTSDATPSINVKNNAFNGTVKLQFGFAAATNFVIDHNYYGGGSATFDGTVTTSKLEEASVNPDADKYATYEAWVAAQ